jgi:hypothetical protein
VDDGTRDAARGSATNVGTACAPTSRNSRYRSSSLGALLAPRAFTDLRRYHHRETLVRDPVISIMRRASPTFPHSFRSGHAGRAGHARALSAALSAALSVVLTVAFTVSFAEREAHASGVTYADGAFARIARERAALVWDAARSTEHLVLDVTFDADAKDFGLLVPVPVGSATSVTKDDAAHIDAIAALDGTSADANADASAERLYAFDVRTLRDGAALTAWLAERGHVARPNLATWAEAYFARGVGLAAIAYVANKPGRHAWRVPALRISFATDAPIFPYAEPSPDAKDESDFERRASAASDAHDAHDSSDAPRTLDLYAIARQELRASGGRAGGLAVAGGRARSISGDALAMALVDASGWGFDARAGGAWLVTRFEESSGRRVGASDYVLVPARTFAAPAGSSTGLRETSARDHGSRRTSSRGVLFALLALAIAFAAVAVFSDRRDRYDP